MDISPPKPMYSLRISLTSGSGFAINVGEDRQTTRAKINSAVAAGQDVDFEAVDGTNTILVVNPRLIDGFMHSPTTPKT